MPLGQRDQSMGALASDPVKFFEQFTPSDSVNFTHPSRAIHLGIGGDLAVRMINDETETIPGLGEGWHPIECRGVLATGTTAGQITAAW